MSKLTLTTLTAAALVVAGCSRSERANTPDAARADNAEERTVAPARAAAATVTSVEEAPPTASFPEVTEPASEPDITPVYGADGDEEPERAPDVVFVPTPQSIVDRMLTLAEVKRGDIVYDLGCGDGRIVITAAKRYGVRAHGFDIDPVRVSEARANVVASGVEDLVTIEQKDIFTLDLSPADVVTLYLLPELNVKLIPQLEKLRPGARIVSHDFDMAGVIPERHEARKPRGEDRAHDIYLWRAPLQKTGSDTAIGRR